MHRSGDAGSAVVLRLDASTPALTPKAQREFLIRLSTRTSHPTDGSFLSVLQGVNPHHQSPAAWLAGSETKRVLPAGHRSRRR